MHRQSETRAGNHQRPYLLGLDCTKHISCGMQAAGTWTAYGGTAVSEEHMVMHQHQCRCRRIGTSMLQDLTVLPDQSSFGEESRSLCPKMLLHAAVVLPHNWKYSAHQRTGGLRHPQEQHVASAASAVTIQPLRPAKESAQGKNTIHGVALSPGATKQQLQLSFQIH